MLAIRKLNNNAVVCRDSLNREVVALGKGIGFGGDFPRELDMAAIERTFYSVDTKGQRIMQDLPADVLIFTARVMDIVTNELPYELSPQCGFDHGRPSFLCDCAPKEGHSLRHDVRL